MIQSNTILLYKKALANYLNVDAEHIFLFWKGRVALYAILKVFGIEAGDEVIMPGFTCVVVPNAVIYLGAKPIYVDIDADTYNMDVKKIEAKITSRTKVILAQNTFGLSPDIDAIKSIAKKHNLIVIEDCTHGFGGRYKNQLNGTIADASFFSSQWNKPFSTAIGGMCVIKEHELALKVAEIESASLQPSMKDSFTIKAMLFARENLMNSFTYWSLLNLYRWMSEKKFIVGSSDDAELKEPVMPADFLKGMSKVQAAKGIKGVAEVDEMNQHRIKISKLYDEYLSGIGIRPPLIPEHAKHTFLKYPLLVNDRKKFFELAVKNKIEIGEWFLSPIHPVLADFEKWHYKFGGNPNAERISSMIVNLPTNVKEKTAEKVLGFIKTNKDLLVNTNIEF